jgi:uroporphyrinogen-III synthase
MPVTNLHGLTVLTLESRRGQEMSRLIATYGGKPFHAPAMREVPNSCNLEVLKFAAAWFEEKFDTVIFLTGVGARLLLNGFEAAHPAEKFFMALRC